MDEISIIGTQILLLEVSIILIMQGAMIWILKK